MNRFFWRISFQILLLQHLCFNINNASYDVLSYSGTEQDDEQESVRLEDVDFLKSNIFGNCLSNYRKQIMFVFLFDNFFSFLNLLYFLLTTNDECVFRGESCPSANNPVTNFATLTHFWKTMFLAISLFTFWRFPKIQIFMEKIPMLTEMDNLIVLATPYVIPLKVFYRIVLSLEKTTENKVAFNTSVFSKLMDYRGWEEFWPNVLNKITDKNKRQLIKLSFIFLTTYLLEFLSDRCENNLPGIKYFHKYFPRSNGSRVIDILFIIFVQKIGFRIFSECLIFVCLPKFPLFQFILTHIKEKEKQVIQLEILLFQNYLGHYFSTILAKNQKRNVRSVHQKTQLSVLDKLKMGAYFKD